MITLICVGRLKEKHYAEACAEYLKRLGRWVRFEVIEFRECLDNNSEVAKEREGRQILERIARIGRGCVIALDMRGDKMSSEAFADYLKKEDIIFVIGGPNGLSKDVLEAADFVLSLSDMTLPHQLARVFLLEQVYRGYSINRGEPYHK